MKWEFLDAQASQDEMIVTAEWHTKTKSLRYLWYKKSQDNNNSDNNNNQNMNNNNNYNNRD